MERYKARRIPYAKDELWEVLEDGNEKEAYCITHEEGAKKIIDALNNIDRVVEVRRRLLENLKEQIKGMKAVITQISWGDNDAFDDTSQILWEGVKREEVLKLLEEYPINEI